jgi:glycosyltransferase involved in cell wall biosynthesis
VDIGEDSGFAKAVTRRRLRPSVLVIGARGIPNVEGGAEKNAEALFPRLAGAGYDVTLLGLSSFITSDSFEGVALRTAPSVWLLKTDKLLYYLLAIVHAIRLRPQIVHLQGLGAALFLWVYKLLGFRVVVRYGSVDYLMSKWGALGRLGFRFSEFQLRHADAVISVAASLTRRLAKRGITANVHYIPNAVDVVCESQAIVPPATKRPYILAVGRVTAQKNIIPLIQAFAAFSKHHPDYDLLIAGGLSDTEYVASLAPLLTDKVSVLGHLPRAKVSSLLWHCPLYVNMSQHEGNSNATLEAISHGCPILVSDIPENRDMNLPPRCYVDQNDLEAVAAAFIGALAEPRKYVVDPSSFLTWEEVVAKTIRVYESVI